MLNQLKRDRSERAWHECHDVIGPNDLPRRLLTQREAELCDELDDDLFNRFAPREGAALVARIDSLKEIMEAALDNEDSELPDPPAARKLLKDMYDTERIVHDFQMDVTSESVRIGYLAGQREGFRLACALLTKVFTTPATAPSADPLDHLPFSNRVDALAMIVGAQVDDSLADSLIERLVTGTVAAPIEGGAE